MNEPRCDRWARTLSGAASRRQTILASFLAGLALLRGGHGARARKRRKKKKIKRNEFGCVSVGGKCRGNDANCCSGICEGKRPRKGKNDKSKCVAHDESTCQPGQTLAECGGVPGEDTDCTTSTGADGECITTTGNAPYCFNGGDCFPCSRDSDCEAVCGPGAACVVCAAGCEVETGGVTACVGLSLGSCNFPM